MKVYLVLEYAPQKQYIRHVIGIFTTQEKANDAILLVAQKDKALKRHQIEVRFTDYIVDESSNEIHATDLLCNPKRMREYGWSHKAVNPWESLRKRRPS